jgi:hypothetical protein
VTDVEDFEMPRSLPIVLATFAAIALLTLIVRHLIGADQPERDPVVHTTKKPK